MNKRVAGHKIAGGVVKAPLQALCVVLIFCCVAVLILQSGVFSSITIQADDYVEYWAAGRLNVVGANPYDPAQLLSVQLTTGRTHGIPVMMWNPPYTLAIVMPLALLPYAMSRTLWYLMSIACVGISALWLWRVCEGAVEQTWVPLVVAFSFYPTIILLQTGQIGGLLLLGFAGFLYFEGRRDYLAGTFAALLAVKPHLMYLFWLALVADAWSRRRWKAPLATLAALSLATVLAAAANPRVVQQYYSAAVGNPPVMWATPTLGGMLRSALGYERAYLQFVPALVGLAWLGWTWRAGFAWDWRGRAACLALMSVVTAVYGWSYDKVLLLIAPISVVALSPRSGQMWVRLVPAMYAGLMLLAFLVRRGDEFSDIWFGPVLLAWYLVAQRMLIAPRQVVDFR